VWHADVKEAPSCTPGPTENGSAPETVQNQRRSSRKRSRQERDADGNNAAKPPGKRAGTPHAAPANSRSAKAAEARETHCEEWNGPLREPPVKPKSTRGCRAKGGAKAESAKASKGVDVTAASCDSEDAQVHVKAEPNTSAAAAAAHAAGGERDNFAPNGAAARAAVQGDQEHDGTTGACSAEEQWVTLNGALDVLAIAPDDEVVAEIVSLQTELLQVRSSPIPLALPHDSRTAAVACESLLMCAQNTLK
jgi:hypothetical protein